MREQGKIIILIVLVTIFAISGYSLFYFLQYSSDIVVENYTVELSQDGTLIETIIYEVKTDGKYRMLFRYWDDTVTYNETIGIPHLNVIGIESPYTSYVKDHSGYVFSPKSLTNDQKSFIGLKAYNNEIGCYNPDYYNKGIYELKITYQLSPPIQHDDQYYHMNFKLASDHIPYNNVKIIINDSINDVVKIFSHPPMDITKTNSQYIITGKSASNSLIEFEIISKNIPYGNKEYENDIYDKTISANNNYNMAFTLISGFNYILLILIFGFGVIIIFLYYYKGREKDYVVPEYLNFIPKKRKPWLVNLVFHKTEISIDENAFYATLLDLHNRKIITLINENDELIINIDKPNEKLDEYETKVFSFLNRCSTNNVFNVKEFEKKILNREYDFSKTRSISEDMKGLTRKIDDDSISYQFIISGRKIPFMIGVVGIIISFFMLILLLSWGRTYPNIYPTFVYSFIFSIQGLIVTAARPTLLGRWKEEYYKEKLEWDGFRKFLSDMAQLKKYELQDFAMWKEWLIYGTALGMGKKVSVSMKKLKVSVSEADMVPIIFTSFQGVNLALITTGHPSSGGGHGGSFGGGGGFGGGGAGGR